MPSSDEHAASGQIDRRTAIKRSIAAGAAAGVVWSAPKIEGLSLRPNYASAMSAGDQFCVTIPDATGVTSAVSSTANGICGGGSIQVQTGKFNEDGARNLRVQTNIFNAATGSFTGIDITPSNVLPGGIDAAGNFAIVTNEAYTVCVKYTCA